MHQPISYPRIILALLGFSLSSQGGASAQPAEYKAADQNFYLRASVLKADPAAVILPIGDFLQDGDSYRLTAHRHPPKEVYLEVMKDWLEPITPPSMPDSLGLAPDVMQIREPQGDVEVAPPTNSDAFVPATEGMPIENGAVVKTGKDGTAAVLFGGVDSARLTPNSEALVQQTVMPELRSTRIDLKAGVVFSKVGLRPGEKQDFQVHTPFGVALAKGTDFVCVALPDRTDVWVVQGTVRLEQPSGQTAGLAKSQGNGALKVIRFPAIKDARLALSASSQTLTMAINFIPTVNLKLKTLHDQIAQGVKLTPQETTYLGLMKQVPCLIRLALVSTPAVAPTPESTPAPSLQPSPPSAPPVKVELLAPKPPPAVLNLPAPVPTAETASNIIVDVALDGSIHFEGNQLSAGHLERRLAEVAKNSPLSTVTIRGDRKWQNERIETVIAMCHEAKLGQVSVTAPVNQNDTSGPFVEPVSKPPQ